MSTRSLAATLTGVDVVNTKGTGVIVAIGNSIERGVMIFGATLTPVGGLNIPTIATSTRRGAQ
ncbi:MAG: hypothetical protein ACHQSE_04925 [Gemmatimonadales bacterium]